MDKKSPYCELYQATRKLLALLEDADRGYIGDPEIINAYGKVSFAMKKFIEE